MNKKICDMCQAETLDRNHKDWITVCIEIYPGMNEDKESNLIKWADLCPKCHESTPSRWNFRKLLTLLKRKT